MRARQGVLLLWACFLMRGTFYACALPVWEGFDEYAHYARIQHIALHGHEPSRDTPLSAELTVALARVPAHEIGMSYDEFWRKQTPAPLRDVRNYEAQQPPVFYWIWAAFYRVLGGGLVPLRILCVLVASAVVPIGFLIARQIFADPRAALGATALITLLPLFTYTATHVANDAPSIALGALIVLLTLRGGGIALAAVLGIALLTKAYFLAFLPPVALLLLVPRFRKGGAIALVGAMLISGWWYANNWLTSGSLTGNLVLVQPGLGKILAALPTFPAWRSIDFIWTTFIWTGNWSFLVVRSWMYHVVAVFGMVALALLWRKRCFEVLILFAFAATFALAIVYFGLASFAAGIGAGSHGWYACCVAAPIAVLAWVSLPRYGGPALTLALVGIELFGTHIYAMPYYTGLISHTASGKLPAYRIGGDIGTMFDRLTIEKPDWLTANMLIGLWALYLLATAVATAVAARSRGAAR